MQTDKGFLEKKGMLAVSGTDIPKPLKVSEYLSMLYEFKRQCPLKRLTEHFGLEGFMNKKVGTLSRGMAQRVALVASLMHEEETLFLDEPMQGLDPFYKKQLVKWIEHTKKAYLIVSHEIESFKTLDCEVHTLESPS